MSFLFFFNDTATTEIYTLSLHDALPISDQQLKDENECFASAKQQSGIDPQAPPPATKTERSEEHTSELQSRLHLVCRLLLEKKKIDPRHEQRVPHSTRSELDTTLRVIVS